MKRTRWFCAMKHKPVRVGFYEFYDALWRTFCMAHWDGESWTTDGDRICPWGICDGDRWRGLLEPSAHEPANATRAVRLNDGKP